MRVSHSKVKKTILSLLLAFSMLLSLVPALTGTAEAALLVPEEVAVTQSMRGTCTLASAAMMIRARLYLSGSSAWSSATEESVRGDVWMEGVGLYYSWTCTVGGAELNGDHKVVKGMSVKTLAALLEQHPEGIELYCPSVPHAVCVTDYEDGVFYCFDPAEYYSGKRIPLSQSWLGEQLGSQESILDAATEYWYISSYSIHADHNVPPTPTPTPQQTTILTQPADQYGVLGGQVTFTVGAEGSGLRYQWQYSRDGETWQNASSTDAFAACLVNQTTAGTWYRCAILNSAKQCVYSDAAQVLLAEAPVITVQPADLIGESGTQGTLAVTAEGEGLTYRWQYSDDGGSAWHDTNATRAKTPCNLTQDRDGRLYRCVVTNVYGLQTISNTAKVVISNALKITAQPQSFTGPAGAKTTLSVTAEGKGLTYQWQYSDDNGAHWKKAKSTSAQISCTLSSANDGRQFRCVIKNGKGETVTSAAARLTVRQTVSITQQPAPVNCGVDATAVFTVGAEGKGLTYRWEYSDNGGKTWTDARCDSATLTCKAAAKLNGRLYRCVVKDSSGFEVASEAALLTVAALQITAQPQSASVSKLTVVRFTVKARGEGLQYQWQISTDGEKWYNAARTENLTWIATDSANGRLVRCIVTDVYGNQAISESARLIVS